MGTEAWIADKDGYQVDVTSRGVLPAESYVDRCISQGKAFSVIDAAVVAPAGVKEYLLVTPNTATRIWWRGTLVSDADGTILLLEGPTTTAAGNALAELNADRNSATAAELVATDDPTVTADGTTLYQVAAPAGGTYALQGYLWRILAANTKYVVRWTDTAGGSNIIFYCEWCEV